MGHELSCHRCGRLFGDAMGELARYFRVCSANWVPAPKRTPVVKKEFELDEDAVAQLELLTAQDVALLEEMGFGGCGREALRATLAANRGCLERAVADLAAR